MKNLTLRRSLIYNTIMNASKINIFMLVQWILFLPLTLPVAILAGAWDGIKKSFTQAQHDILEKEIEI